MKKNSNHTKWSIKLLAVLLTICFTIPAFATESCTLSIDDNMITTEPSIVDGEELSKYYLDVLPEVKNKRTYVPISTIAKFLGATINWQNPTITIGYNKTKLVLNIGESTALLNDEVISLDAPPYISKGRTMVPLRLVSESMGCMVSFKNNNVDIAFPTLKINNAPIAGIFQKYHMTMGHVISESNNNLCITRFYNAFNAAQTKPMIAPTNYGAMYDIDAESCYYLYENYAFKDTNNEILAEFELYGEISFGMNTNQYALKDVLNNKWYSITYEQLCEITDLYFIGSWTEVENTVA